MIEDACAQPGLRAVALRYFNACGADADGELGEAHDPETHLIPNVIRAALDPAGASVKIFGDDYPTPDGTCVRDYTHVEDLVSAHLAALRVLDAGPAFRAFNLGTGTGSSVAEVIEVCRRELGGRPAAEVVPRRQGDAPELVASSALASRELGWRPERTLTDCVRSAVAWHRKQLSGIGSTSPRD
jgi:UDP-glucose 4-epimerase